MKKVLMISTDRQILDETSSVALRMREYAEVFGELHIVVMSQKSKVKSPGTEISGFKTCDSKLILSDKCFVYPTCSTSKYRYIFDAVRIGSKILSDFELPASDFVITSQDPFETGIVGLFLAKKYKAMLNVQIHTDFLSPYFVYGSTLNKMRRHIARYVLPRASSIRVVSERIHKSLIENSKFVSNDSKITVLPLYSEAVPVSVESSDRFPQFEKVVLMVSRLESEKDIETALKAFAMAEKSSLNTGLVIVGSGSREASLSNLAQSLGIDKKVLFLGWRNGDDLVHIRASSDVFLSTSLYEGYGLSLIEASRAGLSIVSTDVGIAPELLPSDKLAIPGDIDGIASLLSEAIHHPERFVVETSNIASVTYVSKDDFLAKLKQSLLV